MRVNIKLPVHLLQRIPRAYLLLSVPVLAFLASAVVSAALTGEQTPDYNTRPAETLSINNLDLPPTATAATETPAQRIPLANRRDCAAIADTDYLSSDERDWFLENCLETQAAADRSANASQPARTSGPSTVGANEYALGDRLIIPAIGVDTTVNGSVVGSDGQMASPVGYFNALWYDFKSYPGVGGYVDQGNLVLAGHVDCGRCINGGPGAAVFYNVRDLQPGDTIEYRTAGGQTVNYTVTSAEWYLPTANWSAILSASAADLSIITCIGNFDTSRREYTHRLVVYAKKA